MIESYTQVIIFVISYIFYMFALVEFMANDYRRTPFPLALRIFAIVFFGHGCLLGLFNLGLFWSSFFTFLILRAQRTE